MVVRDLWESYLFVALTPLTVVFVLVLAQLTTAVGTEAVQVTTVGQGHRVGLTAGDCHDLLVAQGLYPCRIRLIRLVLRVFRQVSDVV